MNPVTVAMRGLIRGYQLLISPVLPASCRFTPSCSSYAWEAIGSHGPLAGSWLAARRICRCHPWNDGGFDPVPPPRADIRTARGCADLMSSRSKGACAHADPGGGCLHTEIGDKSLLPDRMS